MCKRAFLRGEGFKTKEKYIEKQMRVYNFGHAAAMIYIVKNNCSGITKFPVTQDRSDIYGDECTYDVEFSCFFPMSKHIENHTVDIAVAVGDCLFTFI